MCACIELTNSAENALFLYPEANGCFSILLGRQKLKDTTKTTKQGYQAILVVNYAKRAVRVVAQGHVSECEEAAARSLMNVLATEVDVADLWTAHEPERDGDSIVVPSIRRQSRDPSSPTSKPSEESKESKESKEDSKENESVEPATSASTNSTKPSRAQFCVLM